ncbi:MAG TPA: nickel ABC transporter permease subunit NikC [bacterium (Candidatus Stahlbacteria)]|nr:nickel ABC transporter permease subunit NikC [Candidatus Stahlbacteria bacterium]
MHDIVLKIKSGVPSIEVFRRLKKHRLAVIGAVIILTLLFIAIFAPFIAPHDPIEQNLEKRLLPPNKEYPFGTDHLGRCILSRIIYGTRVSLQIGVIVVGISSIIGVVLGLIAGFRGGLIDEIIMRTVDILLAFPGIILALVIAGILGPSLFNVMLALSLIGWTSYARVVRGTVLSEKEKEFVEAAKALGASDTRIMFYHILPNVMAPVIVMATLGIAHVILAAAALSFLGLGAQPPTPEWGSMLNDGRAFMQTAPHLTIFPGLTIMVTVLAFNFLGDGLRDALDPQLKERIR